MAMRAFDAAQHDPSGGPEVLQRELGMAPRRKIAVPALAHQNMALPPPPRGRIAAVALGGALGAGARYLLASRFPVPAGAFPWTTFAINVSGSFLLGVALTMFVERWPHIRHRQSFLCTGVLGAYTTFSTLCVEVMSLVQHGKATVAVGYCVTSVFAGLGGVLLGASFARLRPVPSPELVRPIDPDLGA